MAINYPDTAGQATDGSFAHTEAGITWVWDGTSWKAQGITSNYTLPIATASTLGGIKVGANLSINSTSGLLDASAAVTAANDLSDVTISTPTTGQVLKYNGSAWVNGVDDTGTTINAIDDIGDVDTTTAAPAVGEVLKWDGTNWVPGTDAIGTGLGARQTAQATTASINNGEKKDITITAAKTYALLKIQTSHAAWVTVYTDSVNRLADQNRSESTDPLPGSGVIAEVITSDGAIVNITPGTIGFNNGNPINAQTYLKVVNKSGSTVGTGITVTLTYVQLEV